MNKKEFISVFSLTFGAAEEKYNSSVFNEMLDFITQNYPENFPEPLKELDEDKIYTLISDWMTPSGKEKMLSDLAKLIFSTFGQRDIKLPGKQRHNAVCQAKMMKFKDDSCTCTAQDFNQAIDDCQKAIDKAKRVKPQ